MEEKEIKKIVSRAVDETTGEYLMINISDKKFLIEREESENVINMITLKKLPSSPKFFEGVMHHRGIILPVFNVSEFLTGEYIEKNHKVNYKILIIGAGRLRSGILIDAVPVIVEVRNSDIVKFEEKRQFFKYAVKNIEGQTINCLDAGELLEHIEEIVKGR